MVLNKYIFLVLLWSTQSLGISEFKEGLQPIEGKIRVETKDIYLLVNPGTHSQTKFKLSGELSKLKDQDGSNAELEVSIPKDIVSSEGEAEVKKVIRFLHPKDDLKNYF